MNAASVPDYRLLAFGAKSVLLGRSWVYGLANSWFTNTKKWYIKTILW